MLAFNLLRELNAAGCECWLMSRWGYEGDDPRVVHMSKGWQRVYNLVEKFPINKLLGSCISDWILRRKIKGFAERFECDWVVSHAEDLVGALPRDGFKIALVSNWSIKCYEEGLRRSVENKTGVKGCLARIAFNAIKKRWHRAILQMDKLILLTNVAIKEMIDYIPGFDRRNLVVIPDPIMVNDSSKIISSLNNKRVAFVGRLSGEKGVMRLLSIWDKIHAVRPDYKLDIYGEGYMRQAMLDDVEKRSRGLKDSICFRGYERNLAKIYPGSDLLLMTSDTEGFGMVLIEAMYYGVPCVSFDCPVSPKEVIDNAGVTVPCFDENLYAEAVVGLLGDRDRLLRLQANAIRRSGDFYIDKILKSWMALFGDGRDS